MVFSDVMHTSFYIALTAFGRRLKVIKVPVDLRHQELKLVLVVISEINDVTMNVWYLRIKRSIRSTKLRFLQRRGRLRKRELICG